MKNESPLPPHPICDALAKARGYEIEDTEERRKIIANQSKCYTCGQNFNNDSVMAIDSLGNAYCEECIEKY